MKAFLENEDIVVRAWVIPALVKLSEAHLAWLLPDLVTAIETLAPTNEMWGDDIRLAGLDVLSSRHIREGMVLWVSTVEWRWGLDVKKRMEFPSRYGIKAREVIPGLIMLISDLEQREERPGTRRQLESHHEGIG